MAKKQQPTPSFESAMAKLEEILERMQGENTTLEESIELYATAADLIVFCNKTLEQASVQIEEINQKVEAIGAQDEL